MARKKVVFFGWALVCLICGAASADTVVEKGMVRFVVGDARGAHVEFLIKPRFNSRHVVSFKIRRIGRPGSRLALRVDRADTPIYEAILTRDQCSQGNGMSVCSVTVPGHGAQADAIIKAFTSGRLVHVDVEDGDAKVMSDSASLTGFMAAFRQAMQ